MFFVSCCSAVRAMECLIAMERACDHKPWALEQISGQARTAAINQLKIGQGGTRFWCMA